jgi:hypothetical protein
VWWPSRPVSRRRRASHLDREDRSLTFAAPLRAARVSKGSGAGLEARRPLWSAPAAPLGIGANTAIFSTVHALLLRSLPYPDADRLVMIWEDASFASFPKNTPSPGNYTEWKNQNTVFTDIGAARGGVANLADDGPPERIIGRRVTANFFPVLGVPPALGRAFTADEDRTDPNLVVISYRLWRRRYAGDSGVVKAPFRTFEFGGRVAANGSSGLFKTLSDLP